MRRLNQLPYLITLIDWNRCSALIRNSTFQRGLTCHNQLSGLPAGSKSNSYLPLCRDIRISCHSWFYVLFDMICMSLNMICISKRAINFHPSISIKANGITSHYSGQPRTVTSSYKYAASKSDEKANPFWSTYFQV